MSDVSVTATSVRRNAGTPAKTGTAGAALTAGMPIYKDASDGTIKPAKADSATTAPATGIAVSNAASGQDVFYQDTGPVTFNAGLTRGVVYCVSAANAGGIAPNADLTTSNYVTILGVALSTTVLQLGVNASGVIL